MADAAKCPKEGHIRLVSMPSLEQRLALQGLGGRMVEDKHRRGHRLSLELHRHLLSLHHGSSHADHRLVLPLHHAILLWRVRRGAVERSLCGFDN